LPPGTAQRTLPGMKITAAQDRLGRDADRVVSPAAR
jgi:hypothetical protein